MRILALSLLFFLACSDPSEESTPLDMGAQDLAPISKEGEILPGEGLNLGSLRLRLGDPWSQISAELQPSALRDLGSLGRSFEISTWGLSGLLGPGEEEAPLNRLTLSKAPWTARPGAWGLGSSRAEIQAALGEAQEDPFLKMSWYPALGLALSWREERVSKIEIFPGRP